MGCITKICSRCNTEKPVEEFPYRKDAMKYKCNRESWCKLCKKEYEKIRVMSDPEKKRKKYEQNEKWKSKNPDRYKGKIFSSKWKRVGINCTEADYVKMLEEQQSVCAICGQLDIVKGKQVALSVDHCHTTGNIRGLLCGNCNRAIGLLKDSPELLMKAIKYLQNDK